MPFPLIALAQVTLYAITVYEVHRAASNVYADVNKYKDDLEKTKDEVKKLMKDLESEISDKIDKEREKVMLATLAKKDKQSNQTKSASGRPRVKSHIITAAIQQNIPFRDKISKICQHAEKMPIIQLRERKGKNGIPKSKVDLVAQLLALSAEELASVDVDKFIIVRLKQLAANFMFEFTDQLLNWQGPFKAEVCFGYNSKSKQYLPPKLIEGTRLKREGLDLNPFWPLPYKGRGVVGADLIIPEYRGEPLTLTNIFALIEIKFKGDRIKNKQFQQYTELRKQCAKEKKASDVTASEGFKLSLFRYPEDAYPALEQDSKSKKKKGQGGI